jgi:hypothetical protein
MNLKDTQIGCLTRLNFDESVKISAGCGAPTDEVTCSSSGAALLSSWSFPVSLQIPWAPEQGR